MILTFVLSDEEVK